MPLYEYQCPKCGRFELIQKFSDSPLTECPRCGAEVQKLLSAPAIQFKGTGWYITDYARKGSSGGSGKSGEGSSKAGESGGKSDGGAKDSGGSSTVAKDSAAGGSK